MKQFIPHADHLILMNHNKTVIPNGAVLVGSDGGIQAVGGVAIADDGRQTVNRGKLMTKAAEGVG